MDKEIATWRQTIADNKNIAAALFILLCAGTLYLLVESLGTVKSYGSGPVTNTVTVSGRGEVVAIPDIATFTYSVTEEAKTVAEAQQALNKKMDAALKYLKDSGIAEKDVKTVDYSVYPRYDYNQRLCSPTYCPPPSEGDRVLLGYSVSQSVEVKIRDTSKAGDVIDGIGSVGVSNVSGLNFTVDDIEKVKQEARAKAIADAKTKADILEDDLGVRFGKLVSFGDSSSNPMPPVYYGYGKGGIGMDAAIESRASIPTGENKIVVDVTLVYEVR